MKYLFIILMAVALPVVCIAQQNYRQGYVVTANGDTVKGYINVKEWEISPRSISFKRSLTEKSAVTYTPLSISDFNVGDDFKYAAYTGRLSNNHNVFPYLDNYRDTTTRIDTVFLRELISGSKVSLYDRYEENKRSFFYREGNSAPVELIYYNYYVDGTTIRTLPVYATQLFELQRKYLVTDVKLSDLERISYKQSDLIKEIQKINGDKGVVKPANGGYEVFVGLGGLISQNQFKGDNQFVKAGTVNSFSPKISIGGEYFNNAVTRRFVLRAEAAFSYNKPSFAGEDPLYTGVTTRQHYEFEQYNVSFTPQVLYNYYSSPALRLFFTAGIGLNFSFYKNNRFFTESGAPSYLGAPYKLEKYWSNFPLQLGATVNDRFELAFGYAARAAYTNYIRFGVSSSVLSAGLRYHLKK